MAELLPRLKSLLLLARRYDIGLNIDAEEADRLELSLDLIEAVAHRPRARRLERHRHRRPGLPEALPVRARLADRLGPAHRPPLHGPPGQGRLLGQRDQARPGRRPVRLPGLHPQGPHRRRLPRLRQEAAGRAPTPSTRSSPPTTPTRWPPSTSSAAAWTGSSSACTAWARPSTTRSSREDTLDRPCRVYAPVGTHETLLAYLVRRLLENGANSSFVNRLVDPAVSVDELVADQVAMAERHGGAALRPHPAAARPLRPRAPELARHRPRQRARPALARRGPAARRPPGPPAPSSPTAPTIPATAPPVRNPADHADLVGTVREATTDEVDARAGRRRCRRAGLGRHRRSPSAPPASSAPPTSWRRRCRALMALAVREAGKTLPNAVAEVREAVDFCRYYAAQHPRRVRQPHPQGPAAPSSASPPGTSRSPSSPARSRRALAAGNAVLAKPAEQTPLIAAARRAPVPPRRRARRRAAAAAPATAPRSARPWSPTRASRASSSPARPRWRC